VVAFPVMLLIVLTIVQFAIWSQASHIAQAAASQGLDTTRAYGGTTGAGQDQAQQILDQLDNGPLTGATVDVQRDGQSATVTISGTAESVVPFLHLPIRAHATGPVEAFTTP
jgi:Flp pilus assembly protein TadG